MDRDLLTQRLIVHGPGAVKSATTVMRMSTFRFPTTNLKGTISLIFLEWTCTLSKVCYLARHI